MLKIKEYREVLGEDGKSIRREKIDLKELEKFGYKIIPKGIYAKSIDLHINGIGDRYETFIAIEKDRTIKKYLVKSYLFNIYEEKELHLFRWNIKDLRNANIVEKV